LKEKDLNITEVRGAKANISDLQVYGNGDTFALLCKASSQEQGWMKSTKVCNLPSGCLVQVTTQQKNPDGSYAVAEALTFVPGVNMDKEADPRVLVSIENQGVPAGTGQDDFWKEHQRRQQIIDAAVASIITADKAAELLGFEGGK
jgi:hypothetical protein